MAKLGQVHDKVIRDRYGTLKERWPSLGREQCGPEHRKILNRTHNPYLTRKNEYKVLDDALNP